MSQKRQQDDGKAKVEGNSPEDKRRKVLTFKKVVQEVMKIRSVQRLLEPVLEPLIRRVVKEEVESALKKHLVTVKWSNGKEIHALESRILQLKFVNNLSLPVFTGARIEGDDSTMKVALVDTLTGQVVSSGPESSAKVEIVVLEGDFDGDEVENWTVEEFKNNIVREREGKKPLLAGDAFFTLKEGIGMVGEISFSDNSSWTRSRRFRLGARVVDNSDGTRIREAKTESFIVRDHRGELYKKHHPPNLFDEVWRLEKIGKDGAFHKRLTREGILTVKDFLTLLILDPPRLRYCKKPKKTWFVYRHKDNLVPALFVNQGLDIIGNWMFFSVDELQHGNIYIYILGNHAKDVMCVASGIKSGGLIVTSNKNYCILGTGMSAKMWEVTVDHARTCVLDKRMFLYCPPGSQQKSGVVFNVVGQVMGLLSECQYAPGDKLSETEKVEAQSLVITAYKHWDEVISFEDEASFMDSSLPLTYAVCTSSSPMNDISNGSKSLASQKMGGFDFTQLNAPSPDIMSSIYSVGSVTGLDDYGLHSIENMGLRYDQTMSYPGQVSNSLICDTESITHSFCDEDHLRFFDTDLQSQSITLETQADLQSAVDGFLKRPTTCKTAQMRWTKLFSVLKFFSVRKVVVAKRTTSLPRYTSGM